MKRAAVKNLDDTLYSDFQQRRRDEALQKQKEARAAHTRSIREVSATDKSDKGESQGLVVELHEMDAQGSGTAVQDRRQPVQASNEDMSLETMHVDEKMRHSSRRGRAKGSGRGQRGGSSIREAYAWQLQQPEWMTDIPADLSSSWYVSPRPEGPTVTITAARGRTSSRSRAGILMHTWQSQLPGGSHETATCAAGETVLEAVLHVPNRTYYIMDVLSWNGHPLTDCTTEFRVFMLASKLAEDRIPICKPEGTRSPISGPVESAPHSSSQATLPQATTTTVEVQMSGGDGAVAVEETYNIIGLPAAIADVEAITCAALGSWGSVPDGIYFRHKESAYVPGTPTPLSLLWKDPSCSRYAVDTAPDGSPTEYQLVVLSYREDGSLVTADDPPIALGSLSSAQAAASLAYADGMDASLAQEMDASLVSCADVNDSLSHGTLSRGQSAYGLGAGASLAFGGQGALGRVFGAGAEARSAGLAPKAGKLFRCMIGERGIYFDPTGRPLGADLRLIGAANQRRGRADILSRILFQHSARTNPLLLPQLLAEVSNQASGSEMS